MRGGGGALVTHINYDYYCCSIDAPHWSFTAALVCSLYTVYSIWRSPATCPCSMLGFIISLTLDWHCWWRIGGILMNLQTNSRMSDSDKCWWSTIQANIYTNQKHEPTPAVKINPVLTWTKLYEPKHDSSQMWLLGSLGWRGLLYL